VARSRGGLGLFELPDCDLESCPRQVSIRLNESEAARDRDRYRLLDITSGLLVIGMEEELCAVQ
jgi:hypothetical protein